MVILEFRNLFINHITFYSTNFLRDDLSPPRSSFFSLQPSFLIQILRPMQPTSGSKLIQIYFNVFSQIRM